MHISVILLSLCFMTISNAFKFPDDKKLIYKYHATVKVGSAEPSVYTSRFDIFADVHVEDLENKTLIQLKDVSYSLYMGEGFGETSKKTDMPIEAKDVTLPFVFFVEKSNEFRVGIFVNHDDATWSVNMKRSIATLLHIDEKTLRNERFAEGEVNLHEDSNFGRCLFLYKHIKNDDGHIVFTKSMNYHTCSSVIWNMESLAVQNVDDCGSSGDVLNLNDLKRSYDVVMNSDSFYVDSVHSDNIMLISYGKDENFVFTNQTLKLKSMKDRSVQVMKTSKMVYKSLEFERQYKTDGLYDLTGGRRYSNLTAIKENVRNVLLSVCERKSNIKIDTANVIADERKNLIVLVDEIKHLDEESLYELSKELLQNEEVKDKKQIETYVIALAMAGTTQSLMTIFKLISESIVDEDVAVKVLGEIPHHRKTPESSILDKMLEFAKDESKYEKAIREAAVLSLSASIKIPFDTLYLQVIEDRDYSVYVDFFIDKFQNAVEYDDQYLYMCALTNLQMVKVTDYLFSISKDKNITSHLRSLAVLGILNHMKNVPTLSWNMDKYVLPVFTDTDDNFEVRATALNIILNYGSDRDIVNVLWHINPEKDDHFLRMIHTALESFSESTWDCHRGKISKIKIIQRYIPKPKFTVNVDASARVFDNFDKLNDFGSMIKASAYGDDFASCFIQYTWRFKGFNFDQFSIYMYIKLDQDYKPPILNWVLFATSFSAGKNHSFEIILFRNNLAWKIITYSSVDSFPSFINLFYSLFPYNLNQNFDTELTLGSDVGVPVSLYLKKPSMLTLEQSSFGMVYIIFYDNVRLTHWRRGEYGVKVYNPIADLWHGVQKVQTTDLNFYINQYTSDESHVTLMDSNDSPVGFKSTTQTEIFTDDGSTKSSKVLLNKKGTLEDHVFWSFDDEITGLVYDFKIFDCEVQQKDTLLYQIKQRFLFYNRKNFEDSLISIYEVIFNMWDFISVFPSSGKCGVIMSASKSNKVNITHFELSGKTTGSRYHEDIYKLRNDTQVIKILAMQQKKQVNEFEITLHDHLVSNGNMSLRYEFKILKSKFDLKRPDVAFCLNASRYFRNDEVYLHMLLTKSEEVDKVVTESTLISINMTGKLSKEQIDYRNRDIELYKKCSNLANTDMDTCHRKLTALRSYEYDISYHERIGSSVRTVLSVFIDLMKGAYPGKFKRIDKNEGVDERSIKLSLDYPIYPENSLDLFVIDSRGSFSFENLPLKNFVLKEYLKPYSTYSGTAKYRSILIERNTYIETPTPLYCEFTTDGIYKNWRKYSEQFAMPSNWTSMSDDCINNRCVWEISAKTIEKSKKLMALRLAFDDVDIVDVYIDKDIQIFHNGTLIDLSTKSRYYYTKWTILKVLRNDLIVIVHMQKMSMNLEFDGYSGKMSIVETLGQGKCHEKSRLIL